MCWEPETRHRYRLHILPLKELLLPTVLVTLSVMTPQGETDGTDFDWTRPLLCKVGCDELEAPRAFVQSVVNETFLKVLGEGKARHALVAGLTGCLYNLESDQSGCSSLMKLALSEVMYIVETLLILLGDEKAKDR